MRPDVPSGLDAVIARALTREPADRTPSARAFREELAPYRGPGSDGAPVDATRPLVIPRQPEPTPGPRRSAAATRPVRDEPAGGTALRVFGVALLFAVGIGIGYLGFKTLDRSTKTTTTTTTTIAIAPLDVTAVEALDPPPGDGHESSADVGNVTDGDPATTWSTESYVTADLGGKKGVGLQFTLSASQPVSALVVETEAGPWNGSLYLSDSPFDTRPVGTPAATGTDLGKRARLEASSPTKAQYVLLWITSLPKTGTSDTPYRLTITGAQVLGG